VIWQIYVRYPGAEQDWAGECYALSLVAVGWSNVGDLSGIRSPAEIRKLLEHAYADNYEGAPRRLVSDAGTLWRFARQIAPGDLVLTPDAKGKVYYVGRIRSGYFYQVRKEKRDTCPFLHRRRMRWLGAVSRRQAQRIWGTARIGSIQTVARIRGGGGGGLLRLVGAKAKGRTTRVVGTRGRPDPLWGRAAEERALKWLSARGLKPRDVAHLSLGWDIECGDMKYEVKGRRSSMTVIRMTENEYKKALNHKEKYILLVFTAGSLAELKKCLPDKIPDPVRTRDWAVRMAREYLMEEE
jgi:hypothetical protein